MNKKIFKSKITFEMVVAAKSMDEALAIIQDEAADEVAMSIREDAKISIRPVNSKMDIDDEWLPVEPPGGDADETVEDILTASMNDLTPPFAFDVYDGYPDDDEDDDDEVEPKSYSTWTPSWTRDEGFLDRQTHRVPSSGTGNWNGGKKKESIGSSYKDRWKSGTGYSYTPPGRSYTYTAEPTGYKPPEAEIIEGEDIEKMRRAGRLAAEALAVAKNMCWAGVSTLDIDHVVRDFIIDKGGYPSTYNYPHGQIDPKDPEAEVKGFPCSTTISVNEVVAHGVPKGDIILEDGDIVSIDITTLVDGFHGDICGTYAVGVVDQAVKDFLVAAEAACLAACLAASPGKHTRDISQAVVDSVGTEYGILNLPSGHGIGTKLHQSPTVKAELPKYQSKWNQGDELKAGMCVALEPAISLRDKWTTYADNKPPVNRGIYTKDGSRSAQFEHTVMITENGPEILTLPTT